jgi:hypothetical protein
MNWLADKAAVTLADTGKITAIVEDNGSIYYKREQ